MFTRGKTCRIAISGLIVLTAARGEARRPDGRLELRVVDAESGQPLAARIELTDGRGRPVRPDRTPEPLGAARLENHAYLDGTGVLGLRRGAYRFTLDAGPEYRTAHGHFEIDRHAEDTKTVEMRRAADLSEEGWRCADLASCRPDADYDLLRRAESLSYTPKVVAQWNGDRWVPPPLAERRKRDKDSPGASALWSDPRGVVWLIDPDNRRSVDDLPEPSGSTVDFLRVARDGGWRVIASVTSQELPLWVAHDVLDAVIVIDGWIESPTAREATQHAREPDPILYPGPQGPARWRRALYESLIDAGVRLPPVALSGSGLNKTPLGSARAYAFGDDWWAAADELAVVATNGPLLRPFVEGTPPGEAFEFRADREQSLSIALNLATRTPIEYLQIVKNGRVERTVRLAQLAASGGRLPDVAFDAPGWLALAAVTEASDRYEYALSAPWFVGERTDPEDAAAWLTALRDAEAAFGSADPEAYAAAEAFWVGRAGETAAGR